MNETLWVPLVAVLGPLLGSAVGVLLPSRKNLLPRLLAFAAGTMLTISFLELIPESMAYCPPAGCFAGLAVGVLGVLALRLLLPETRHDGRERHTALLMLAAIAVAVGLWWSLGMVLALPREVAELAGLLPLLALFWYWRPPPAFEKEQRQEA